MNIAIYNKNKITLEPIAAIGYIIGSRAKRKGPAGKAGPFLQHDISEREVKNGQKDSY
ncbi:hypothetical protein [Enterocloster clostridioformis]|uniref:hypothetical protein n=1 Tax=Enterocloster clostridioformis TaxID=1531 RepID=UPI000A9B24AA|nr:hypothetical protein [Enterocloster clostridioformis]MCA5577574.1 hypothetical protein [Enterocloster clostridioformis]